MNILYHFLFFFSRLLFSISIHALFQTIEQVKRRDTFTHGFRCLASLLRPKSRGTLRIRSADPFEYPALDPHYLENPEDLAQLVRGSYSLLTCRFCFWNCVNPTYPGLSCILNLVIKPDDCIHRYVMRAATFTTHYAFLYSAFYCYAVIWMSVVEATTKYDKIVYCTC